MLPNKDNIVGSMQTAVVQVGESLGDIGKRFDVGVYEMIEANPKIDPWTPKSGTEILIPTQFILPATERLGVVINLAEMRLYFYHPDAKLVSTYPIGIGRKGWVTPLLKAKITNKQYHPTWQPPLSIMREHEIKGDPLPQQVPPGPKNPLGEFAIYLSASGYLIHGTNRPGGIGLRTTSGCIRLFPEDIKALFHQVSIGTPVKIIHEPYKIGIYNHSIYIEVHEPLSDLYYNKEPTNVIIKKAIQDAKNINSINFDFSVLESEIIKLTKETNGYPVLIQTKFAQNKGY